MICTLSGIWKWSFPYSELTSLRTNDGCYERSIAASSRIILLFNDYNKKITQKRDCNMCSYASDKADEASFTQATVQTNPAPLHPSAILNTQTHPLPFDFCGLSFKNLLHDKIRSCDS